jgi:hypothetical protein
MKKCSLRHYLGLALLLSLMGCKPAAEAGAVASGGIAARVGTLQQFAPETASWLVASSPIVLETAINESESVVLQAAGMQGKAFHLGLSPLDGSGIAFKWYQVMQGNANGGVMDALIEPDANGMVYPSTATSQYLLKAIVPAGTAAGTYRWNMQATANGQMIHNGDVKVIVHPVTLGKSGINLQGNLLFKRDDVPDDIVLSLLEKMRGYDFTGLVLPKQLFKTAALGKVENYALDNFQYIRMSPRTLFTRKKTLGDTLLADGITRERWLQDECAYVSQSLARMKRNARPHNVFTYKLWDEPVPENYAEVAYGYNGLKQCASGVPLELTEPPAVGLGDVADIWTVNINALNAGVVKKVRQQNDHIYLYANYLHEITDNPLRIRNAGWLMGYFGLEGYHFWSVANWGNGALNQSEGETGREERGTLFYWDEQNHRVLSSLRMEMFHEGLDDMQLLGQVKACAAAAGTGSAAAAQALAQVDRAVQQWDFNNQKSNVPVLTAFRNSLLGAADACHTTAAKARRPLSVTR